MYTIALEEMEFWAHHGCFPEERTIGNRFTVDLSLSTDRYEPCASDRLEDAVDYQQAYRIVEEEMNIPSHLLEHVAARILDKLEEELPGWMEAQLTIRKHNPPLGGKIGCSKVSFRRTRA